MVTVGLLRPDKIPPAAVVSRRNFEGGSAAAGNRGRVCGPRECFFSRRDHNADASFAAAATAMIEGRATGREDGKSWGVLQHLSNEDRTVKSAARRHLLRRQATAAMRSVVDGRV